jgi:hypothetical protein
MPFLPFPSTPKGAVLCSFSLAAVLFHQSHPNIQVNVTGGGSVAGLQAVTTNKVDIADSDIYADPSTYPDPNLTDHIICAMGFVLIVDPQINLSSLSTQQIHDIFSGKVSNWQEVGGQWTSQWLEKSVIAFMPFLPFHLLPMLDVDLRLQTDVFLSCSVYTSNKICKAVDEKKDLHPRW